MHKWSICCNWKRWDMMFLLKWQFDRMWQPFLSHLSTGWSTAVQYCNYFLLSFIYFSMWSIVMTFYCNSPVLFLFWKCNIILCFFFHLFLLSLLFFREGEAISMCVLWMLVCPVCKTWKCINIIVKEKCTSIIRLWLVCGNLNQTCPA